MTDGVQDARPSALMTGVLNPILSLILRTPAARLIKPFAVLEFTGRRSGKRYRTIVGWYEDDRTARVFSPAAWRVNFANPAVAIVYYRGRKRTVRGALVRDPEAVAAALDSVLARGVSPRMLGMAMPSGHRITATDVVALRREMIEFHDER